MWVTSIQAGIKRDQGDSFDYSDLEEVASETCKVPPLNIGKDTEDVGSEGVVSTCVAQTDARQNSLCVWILGDSHPVKIRLLADVSLFRRRCETKPRKLLTEETCSRCYHFSRCGSVAGMLHPQYSSLLLCSVDWW